MNINIIKNIEDLQNAIGHSLGDTWIDDAGNEITLEVYNNIICYVYNTKLTDDELTRYFTNSIKMNVLTDILSTINIKDKVSYEYGLELGMKHRAEGQVELAKFIRDMKEKYKLLDGVDFMGAKFFVPIIDPKTFKEGECKCHNHQESTQ